MHWKIATGGASPLNHEHMNCVFYVCAVHIVIRSPVLKERARPVRFLQKSVENSLLWAENNKPSHYRRCVRGGRDLTMLKVTIVFACAALVLVGAATRPRISHMPERPRPAMRGRLVIQNEGT